METLIVYREWIGAYNQQTILKDMQGRVKKIINSPLQQPKYKQLSIDINNKIYCLNWDKVKLIKGKTINYEHR